VSIERNRSMYTCTVCRIFVVLNRYACTEVGDSSGTLGAHVRVTDLDTRCDIIPLYTRTSTKPRTTLARIHTYARTHEHPFVRDHIHVTSAYNRNRFPWFGVHPPTVRLRTIRMRHTDGARRRLQGNNSARTHTYTHIHTLYIYVKQNL